MHAKLDKAAERWAAAGLLDAATLGRIRAFEAEREKSTGLSWPVYLALAFGAVLLGAGVLLFVAAHWDELSPAERFSIVLGMTAVFHAAGTLATERFAPLSSALHAVGTVTLGAGIFLAGQIFNLAEHWPGGIMMWAVGAWAGWLLLRDWPHAAIVALLTPAWLASEWFVRTSRDRVEQPIIAEGLLLLALTYLSAMMPDRASASRRALVWIGALALLPLTFFAIEPWLYYYYGGQQQHLSLGIQIFGMFVGIGAPLVLAYLLRQRAAWMNGVSALWVVMLAQLRPRQYSDDLHMFMTFLWLAAGAAGLCAWGQYESRQERLRLGLLGLLSSLGACMGWAEMDRTSTEIRAVTYVICFLTPVGLAYWGLRAANKQFINTSVALFAVTVMFFYFSNVMDKLGRSASLIGFGIIFLMGGWSLERLRRRLVARVIEAKP